LVPDIQMFGRRHRGNQQGRQARDRGRPARLRRKFGIEEGQRVVAEERPDGIPIRPAVALPVEIYTPERKAAFLLSNAVDP
jgi:hypothetical protein